MCHIGFEGGSTSVEDQVHGTQRLDGGGTMREDDVASIISPLKVGFYHGVILSSIVLKHLLGQLVQYITEKKR